MIFLFTLNTRGAGTISYQKLEILGKHSLGIDTALAILYYPTADDLGVLVQANVQVCSYSWQCVQYSIVQLQVQIRNYSWQCVQYIIVQLHVQVFSYSWQCV